MTTIFLCETLAYSQSSSTTCYAVLDAYSCYDPRRLTVDRTYLALRSLAFHEIPRSLMSFLSSAPTLPFLPCLPRFPSHHVLAHTYRAHARCSPEPSRLYLLFSTVTVFLRIYASLLLYPPRLFFASEGGPLLSPLLRMHSSLGTITNTSYTSDLIAYRLPRTHTSWTALPVTCEISLTL